MYDIFIELKNKEILQFRFESLEASLEALKNNSIFWTQYLENGIWINQNEIVKISFRKYEETPQEETPKILPPDEEEELEYNER